MAKKKKVTETRKAKPEAGRDPKDGKFLPGNKFWEARSSAGQKPKFKTPEELWDACVEYFDWVHDNPLIGYELSKFQGEGKQVPVSKMQSMTINGLCIFLDIGISTWQSWKKGDKKRPDLLGVISQVEEIIYTQKFNGAAAGFLNPNIIARDLGLSDKQEHTGKDGGAIEIENKSDLDIARRLAFALSKGLKENK